MIISFHQANDGVCNASTQLVPRLVLPVREIVSWFFTIVFRFARTFRFAASQMMKNRFPSIAINFKVYLRLTVHFAAGSIAIV